SRGRLTISVSAFLLNRSSDLMALLILALLQRIFPSIGNSFINTMKNINHTRSSISDDIRNILCSSANMRRAIPLILRLLMNEAKIGRASWRAEEYSAVRHRFE